MHGVSAHRENMSLRQGRPTVRCQRHPDKPMITLLYWAFVATDRAALCVFLVLGLATALAAAPIVITIATKAYTDARIRAGHSRG